MTTRAPAARAGGGDARTGGGRSRWLLAVVVTAAAAVTLLTALLPGVPPAFRSPPGHIIIETTTSLVALLAALLLAGRSRMRPTWGDYLLTAALTVMGLSTLLFYLLPSFAEIRIGVFGTWAPLTGSLLGVVCFAVGAWLPHLPVRRPRPAVLALAGAATAALTAIGVLVTVLEDGLPASIDPTLSPQRAVTLVFEGHPGVLAANLVGAVALWVAVVGLLHRARTGDEFMLWLAAAAACGAFSRLNYVIFPSRYTEWVYTGDFLRLGFYLLVAVGAAREIARAQAAQAGIALLEERRRVARDVHDGLAQELAYIATGTRALVERVRDDDLVRISSAAERALDEARHAIATLSRPSERSLGERIADAATTVGERAGARVELRLEDGVRVAEEVAAALERIVREAVSNAVRHGRAQRVVVELRRDDDIRLRIRDDGIGFDLDVGAASDGFGLASMRERAREVGGSLQVRSRPDDGTEVQVRLPRALGDATDAAVRSAGWSGRP